MDAQSWSYTELTAAVEAEIKLQLQKAHVASSELERRSCRDYAVGTYFAWESIMRAHSAERRLEDAQRLGEMVSPSAHLISASQESINSVTAGKAR